MCDKFQYSNIKLFNNFGENIAKFFKINHYDYVKEISEYKENTRF